MFVAASRSKPAAPREPRIDDSGDEAPGHLPGLGQRDQQHEGLARLLAPPHHPVLPHEPHVAGRRARAARVVGPDRRPPRPDRSVRRVRLAPRNALPRDAPASRMSAEARDGRAGGGDAMVEGSSGFCGFPHSDLPCTSCGACCEIPGKSTWLCLGWYNEETRCRVRIPVVLRPEDWPLYRRFPDDFCKGCQARLKVAKMRAREAGEGQR